VQIKYKNEAYRGCAKRLEDLMNFYKSWSWYMCQCAIENERNKK